MGITEYRQAKLNKVLEVLADEQTKKNIENGIFNNGCTVYNFHTDFLGETGDILSMDGTELKINGYDVAELQARMGCWILKDESLGVKLSPEQLPTINGMPTISYTQYEYMCSYLQPKFEMSKDTEMMTYQEREKYEQRLGYVINRYNEIPESVMHILQKMDKHPTETDIQNFCRENGDNIGCIVDGKIPVSFDDLIICTFGENVTRIPELEKDTSQLVSEEKSASDLNDDFEER